MSGGVAAGGGAAEALPAPPDLLAGRRILLGVAGSIAAYKAVAIASRLVQAGALVDVVLTAAAARLVTPLAFRAVTHRPVSADLWDPQGALAMDHVALARAAEAFVVAPATADVLARLALGLADDALTTTALAVRAPLLLAPAMEPRMWDHPATAGHVATLVARGASVVGPMAGRMASGESGLGRLAEPDEVVERLRCVLAQSVGGALTGRRIVVAAGPTREPIDPVRYLSNHSSGRMGLELARLARDRGADVTLILGAVEATAPDGVERVDAPTAAAMHEAVMAHAAGADAVIMAAAIADFRPAPVATSKIKKGAGAARTLSLEPTLDVLAELGARYAGRADRPFLVGFAAETDDLVANARAKLSGKGVDLVVANPVPESFGGARSTATLVDADGEQALGPADKRAVAGAILDRVAAARDAGAAGAAPFTDRKSTRLNSSHEVPSRMPSSA